MPRTSTNPYLLARQFAGLNRVQAAMMLPSSETSLKEYETGLRNVPDDMVLRMVSVYRTPWLRVQHLAKNPVFRDLFAGRLDVEVGKQEPEAMGALRLQKELTDVAGHLPCITQKILDGTSIGPVIIKDLKEVTIAALNFIAFSKNSEAACAPTQTASGK